MTWKKERYLITIQEDAEKTREYVDGITSYAGDFKIGIHKSAAAVWIVTDIGTGYMMHIQFTRKGAKEWVETNSEIIQEMLSKPARENIIKDIEKCNIKLQ